MKTWSIGRAGPCPRLKGALPEAGGEDREIEPVDDAVAVEVGVDVVAAVVAVGSEGQGEDDDVGAADAAVVGEGAGQEGGDGDDERGPPVCRGGGGRGGAPG